MMISVSKCTVKQIINIFLSYCGTYIFVISYPNIHSKETLLYIFPLFEFLEQKKLIKHITYATYIYNNYAIVYGFNELYLVYGLTNYETVWSDGQNYEVLFSLFEKEEKSWQNFTKKNPRFFLFMFVFIICQMLVLCW